MNNTLNKISEIISEDSISENNLFVKNIIVNKKTPLVRDYVYIPTEKWMMQLGKRLETNY